jgi:hypothetical protein
MAPAPRAPSSSPYPLEPSPRRRLATRGRSAQSALAGRGTAPPGTGSGGRPAHRGRIGRRPEAPTRTARGSAAWRPNSAATERRRARTGGTSRRRGQRPPRPRRTRSGPRHRRSDNPGNINVDGAGLCGRRDLVARDELGHERLVGGGSQDRTSADHEREHEQEREMGLQWGQIRGIWMQPADAAGTRLALGDAQGGGGRAGSDDLQATSGKQAGEGSLSRSRCPGRSQR